MNQTLHAENAACALTITAYHPTPDLLRLEYRVLNRTAAALYLCNIFWQDSRVNPATREEEFDVSPNDAYLKIEDDHLKVALSTIRAAISDGMAIHFIPLLTRVEPQQQFAAALDLALPLAPYLKADNAAASDGPVLLPLHFELGYFLGDAQTEKYLNPVVSTAGKAYQIPPFLSSSLQLIGAGPFSEPVAVAPWLGKDVTRPWE